MLSNCRCNTTASSNRWSASKCFICAESISKNVSTCPQTPHWRLTLVAGVRLRTLASLVRDSLTRNDLFPHLGQNFTDRTPGLTVTNSPGVLAINAELIRELAVTPALFLKFPHFHYKLWREDCVEVVLTALEASTHSSGE